MYNINQFDRIRMKADEYNLCCLNSYPSLSTTCLSFQHSKIPRTFISNILTLDAQYLHLSLISS